MEISKYWNGISHFTAEEAACLISGIEPNRDAAASCMSVRHTLKIMNYSYIEACGLFRYLFETDHRDDYNYWEEMWEDDSYKLPSVDIWRAYYQWFDAPKIAVMDAYRDHALSVMDRILDDFLNQCFLDEDIDVFIKNIKIKSAFDFVKPTNQSPHERRLHVQSVVAECGGNKAKAARILNISRQRVDQLLAENVRGAERKTLRESMQGPFAGLYQHD